MLFGLVFFMAQFLQTGLGFGALSAGLQAAARLGDAGRDRAAGRLAGGQGGHAGELVLSGGLAAAAVGLTWMALIARTGLPYWQIVPPLIVAGTGVLLRGARHAGGGDDRSAVGRDRNGFWHL